MLPLKQSHHNFTASSNKGIGRSKVVKFLSDGFFFGGATLMAFLLVWSLWSFITATPATSPPSSSATASGCLLDSVGPELPGKNFYDDPELKYTIDSPPVKNWNAKRSEWLRQHPSFAAGAANRILMVTGSQPAACTSPGGDHLLLKLFKNKVDYGRRHGIGVFYNNAHLHPKMNSFWAKTPALKAAMLAHPEAEWIWWVDADAAFTDMDFEVPLGRYVAHNMVVPGWPSLVYEERSWIGLNAGVFLIRNCQWAMDFMDAWAGMGPQSADYERWGKIQTATFKDKLFPNSDDQSGLAYLLVMEEEKWGHKIYLENEYTLHGYWLVIEGTFTNATEEYRRIEAAERRHAEGVSVGYGRAREEKLKAAGARRWPFVTHFTGCQPCSGGHNQVHSGQSCVEAMHEALTFADNQVLRNYGFMHPDLHDPATVEPLPFGLARNPWVGPSNQS